VVVIRILARTNITSATTRIAAFTNKLEDGGALQYHHGLGQDLSCFAVPCRFQEIHWHVGIPTLEME